MGGEPFVGMLLLVPYNFAPLGFNFCDGSLVAIAENDALYSLLGTTYGGDGQTTFALPDLRSRVAGAEGQGGGLSNYILGQSGGADQVTLPFNQYPNHNHTMTATSTAANVAVAQNNILGSIPANGP